ncbi:hypothetical protein GMA12_16900 [Kocuria sediminis]|uniref:GH15-like domain-containing protein n=1 Tax=Kocuria sediminis TaxID=1038857 RepID=A0A6N8GRG6_9MICC|nr:glycoside hydrolase family 15 protein [Kocuria sediminis]MUN64797.1 hypothetical protein [Kocuria sediminis]
MADQRAEHSSTPLVEQFARGGRPTDARALLDELVGYAADLGLYAEEYAPAIQRLAGNSPQAFSHLSFIRTTDAVEEATGEDRLSERDRRPTAGHPVPKGAGPGV